MVEKKNSNKKKGGMQINPNATPMTNYDLANGYSKLINGGKSKRGRKSTKGGTMELNPSENPLVNSDLAHGLSTLTGGKSGRKSSGRKTKKGGADPNLGGNSAFYNMDNLVSTATPYTMAGAQVDAASAVTPFSAGMPNYASVEYGLPITMTNPLTGGLDQSTIVGGSSKSRKSSGRKTKKGGELSIMSDLNKILERLNSNKNESEVVGGKSKRGKKSKKGGDGSEMLNAIEVSPAVDGGSPESVIIPGVASPLPLTIGGKGKGKRGRKSKNGGGDTLAKLLTIQNAGNSDFSGTNDWQTQLELDNIANMPGGGKSKRKNKK